MKGKQDKRRNGEGEKVEEEMGKRVHCEKGVENKSLIGEVKSRQREIMREKFGERETRKR